MKKILSLFMSIVLISSMIFSTVYAADTLYIKPADVLIDMTEAATITHVAGATGYRHLKLDDVTNYSLQLRNRSITNILPSFEGYTNVLEYGRTTGAQNIAFYTANKSENRPVLSDGTFLITAKFRANSELSGDRTWYVNYGLSDEQDMDIYETADAVKLLPNIWYDVEYKVNLDSTADNVTMVYTPELTGLSSAETAAYTMSKTGSYTGDALSSITAYVYTATGTAADSSTPRTYWANIKAVHYSGTSYPKAQISSIGTEDEVASGQKNISFTLSEEIPGLSKADIFIRNLDADTDVSISSAAVSGDGKTVNLITGDNLPAETNFELTISSDAWGNASLQTNGVSETKVTAIRRPFHSSAKIISIVPGNAFIDTSDYSKTLGFSDKKITLDGTTNETISFNKNLTPMTSFDGYKNVLKGTAEKQYFTVSPDNPVSGGAFLVNMKFFTTGNMTLNDWYINYGRRDAEDKKIEKRVTVSGLVPNTWYDVEYKFNMDSSVNNVSLTFTPESSGAGVITQTLSYTNDIVNIRPYLTVSSDGNYYLADIKAVHYNEAQYPKANISSIGISDKVTSGQNNIPLELTEAIPGLSKEDIIIKNKDTNENIPISDVSHLTPNKIVTVVTSKNLPSWTNFELIISSDAWGRASLQTDGETETKVTALRKAFYTPEESFDMKLPEFELDGGNLKITTTLVNKNAAEDITMVIAVYGADGRIKEITPTTYAGFTNSNTATEHVFTAPFTTGDKARVFVVNGWTERTPLFGKSWTYPAE